MSYLLLPEEVLVGMIYLVDLRKDILNFDLSLLNEILFRRINEQVKRNNERFPSEFVFQLGVKQRSYLLPYNSSAKNVDLSKRSTKTNCFNIHGARMLSSILMSPSAIQIKIQLLTQLLITKSHVS